MTRSILAIALLGLATRPTVSVAGGEHPRGRALQGPPVVLWTDRDYGTVYHRGERVRVYFRTDEDAYVTVFRVDTDGRVRVLFPEDPWDDNFARGGRAYEIRPREERYAFAIDEYPGEGYVFAIATADPFDYRNVVRGDHWDYRVMGTEGRIAGDPYVGVMDLVDVIVPVNYDAYSYDVFTYYVEQYYEYPRFLCYDCHSYVTYTYWDPYHYSCRRFRIVVYDNAYYYPARVYTGNRVVYRQVAPIEPRYVFKDRGAADAYVVRVRERPAEPATRRVEDRGATGRDVGGVGTLPAPGVRTPVGRAPQTPTTQAPRTLVEPARRPDLVGGPDTRRPEVVPDRRPIVAEPADPRRVPDRVTTPPTTDRPPAPGAVAAPDRRAEPTLVPRTNQPTRTPPQGDAPRPRLERRDPPERQPAARPEPQPRQPTAEPRAPPVKKPETAPPVKKPVAPPVKKPDAPQVKKPEAPARRTPGD